MEKRATAATAIDRSGWQRPWAQLKYFTFQPAIFPRLLGQVSPDARPGDLVTVYDKNGERAGAGIFNPRAKIPLRVLSAAGENGAGPTSSCWRMKRSARFRRVEGKFGGA